MAHSRPRQRAVRVTVALAVIGVTAAFAGPDEFTTNTPLTVHQAVDLALIRQPLLGGIEAEAQAARESAVAAAALPDPEVFIGVRDLPVADDEAFSLSRDSDTQLVAGVRQVIPSAGKRRLRGSVREREAVRLDIERAALVRKIRRETALAWLALWREERALALLDAQLDIGRLEADAVRMAMHATQATQAELLRTELAVDRWHDDVAAADQRRVAARARLQRWIGSASRLPTAELPGLPAAGTLQDLRAALPQHPAIEALDARIVAARAATDLAVAGRHPDFSVSFGYGHRREFADMVMLEVGMGLPLFPRDRQDREVAAAIATVAAVEAARDDALRRFAADLERLHAESVRLDARVRHYDTAAMPRAAAAVDAATAAWRSSRGRLADVLAARRAELATRLARLDVAHEAAARRIELEYFAPVDGDPVELQAARTSTPGGAP